MQPELGSGWAPDSDDWLAFSPDGTELAADVGASGIELYSTGTGTQVGTVPGTSDLGEPSVLAYTQGTLIADAGDLDGCGTLPTASRSPP